MKASKSKILVATFIGALSLIGLVVIQFEILNRDLELKNEQIKYAIPSVLMDVEGRWYHNRSLIKLVKQNQGTREFTLTNFDQPKDAIQREIHQDLHQTLTHNYPDLEYELNVFISSEYSCLIHSHHNAHLQKANKVINSQNNICMCQFTE